MLVKRFARFPIGRGDLCFLPSRPASRRHRYHPGQRPDTTGAALARAKITVTNVDTNFSRTTVTDATGEYRFLSLPAGTYTVEAELDGFQRFVAGNIVLSVDQQRRVDIPMQVGSLQQRVEVNATAVQVETTNTQLGTVIDEKNIVNLPLNGRSYIDLLSIQAGVAPSGGAGGLISVNGQREESNSFLVNGGDVNEGRRMTAGRGAEPGFGGRIPADHQFVRRRVRPLQRRHDERHHENGNQWLHGAAFEFLRNSDMDAAAFFDSAVRCSSETSSATRSAGRRSRTGCSGSPIIKAHASAAAPRAV